VKKKKFGGKKSPGLLQDLTKVTGSPKGYQGGKDLGRLLKQAGEDGSSREKRKNGHPLQRKKFWERGYGA